SSSIRARARPICSWTPSSFLAASPASSRRRDSSTSGTRVSLLRITSSEASSSVLPSRRPGTLRLPTASALEHARAAEGPPSPPRAHTTPAPVPPRPPVQAHEAGTAPLTALGHGVLPMGPYIPWADLLKRSFSFDVLRCPCGGTRRVVDFVLDPQIVRHTLA